MTVDTLKAKMYNKTHRLHVLLQTIDVTRLDDEFKVFTIEPTFN